MNNDLDEVEYIFGEENVPTKLLCVWLRKFRESCVVSIKSGILSFFSAKFTNSNQWLLDIFLFVFFPDFPLRLEIFLFSLMGKFHPSDTIQPKTDYFFDLHKMYSKCTQMFLDLLFRDSPERRNFYCLFISVYGENNGTEKNNKTWYENNKYCEMSAYSDLLLLYKTDSLNCKYV